jgi:catechol-2,3-dioxygenase
VTPSRLRVRCDRRAQQAAAQRLRENRRRRPQETAVEINGIAHLFLTVSDIDKALPFYEKLLVFLGMKPVMKSATFLYCVGGRTAVG